MTTLILAALILYFVQTLLPVTFRYRGNPASFNARDEMPATTVLVGRAERALVNVGEAMILFLPLALLTLNVEGAVLGATIFLLARVAHVVLYLTGVPYLRTIVWAISLVGLVMMAQHIV
ncbi:MAPEG family protein [Shimia sp. R9_3]|uniref:MAPEG family protein n=1 Tax=Shimia sp. R9_3 TaxID=2821113 RepID=UPI001ADA5375|nr:MAPEG family protein [Shimia sp. R9_3]MBO9402586.1 MAPEG family protein [Shimia sp. R9_3]